VKPLSVLYLIDSLGPGGAQRQLTTLVRSLDRATVSPEVAIYYPFYRFRAELDGEGVPIHMLGPGGGRNPTVLLRLVRLMSRRSFDLVHAYLRTPGVLARVASILTPRTAVVVSERSTGLGSHPWRLALERALAARADAFIVNSHAMEGEILSLIPRLAGRLFVVPNGVLWTKPSPDDVVRAAAFREANAKGAELVLLALARFSREKGPDVLVEALHRLSEETVSRLRVVWVGARVDEELFRAVESRVAGGALAERVRFLRSTEDTTSAYLGSDALVLPSRREGLPNVVLEALAHGRPVIATDVGDCARIVTGSGGGWIVPPQDPDALADAIDAFASTDPDRRKELGANGSAFVLAECSVGRLRERTMEVYDSALSHRAGTGRE
jgi:glycosyltransferase involved in cell wall biosynthesis